jgi:hypothetical protein
MAQGIGPEPEGLDGEEQVAGTPAVELESEEAGGDDTPDWARPWVPPDLAVPPGAQVCFMRFPSAWTAARDRGVMVDYPTIERNARGERVGEGKAARLSRVLVCWPITIREENLALKRVRDPTGRGSTDEKAKAFIRAVDGKRVDWTGSWRQSAELYSPEAIWEELGPKCRGPVRAQYLTLHQLSDQEMLDFLADCLVVTSAVPA